MRGQDEAMPFHGIVPRAAVGTDAAGLWPWIGALFELVGQDPAGERIEHARRFLARWDWVTPTDAEAAIGWLVEAESSGVVTHAAGRRLVQRCLVDWGRDPRLGDAPVACVKEGHTASVWRVPAGSIPDAPELAVLVPRDQAAADELAATTTLLERYSSMAPDQVMSIWARSAAHVESLGGALPVSVVAGEWIVGARELHAIRGSHGRSARVVAVDAFTSGRGSPFAGQDGVVGLGPSSGSLWRAILELRVRLTSFDGDTARLARFEINDGDFVERGGDVLAVACSDEASVDTTTAVVDLVLTSALDDAPGSDGARRLGYVIDRAALVVYESLSRSLGCDHANDLVRRAAARCAADLPGVLDLRASDAVAALGRLLPSESRSGAA